MEFAGVIAEKWIKVLTKADLESDEMVSFELFSVHASCMYLVCTIYVLSLCFPFFSHGFCIICVCQRLPKKFLNKHGNRVQMSFILKLRNGYQIPIVFNDEKGTFFGLSPLYDDFGFEAGQMLVFEFDGSCHFNVYVIGSDLVEIVYPPVVHHMQNNVGRPRVGKMFLQTTQVVI